jgi:hypothetical protein
MDLGDFRNSAYSGEDIIKLSIGRFMSEWTKDLLEITQKKSEIKLSVFSTHDSSISPLLSSMEIFSESYPDFGSNVIFFNIEDYFGIVK